MSTTVSAKDDLLFQSIGELGTRLRRREVTSLELTELSLARLDTIGRSLNCVATLTPDLAREQAKQADKELKAGRDRGPLHGIPWGAKDLLDTAGIATTWGAKPYENRVPTTDATVIKKLRDAGAVLVAKLAMVELAGGLGYHFGTASLQGPMRNPWNKEKWTGGSSSGSGAAVAAGLVPIAIGTETWGSILCPSAFCGITGLRPTYGRVSRAGAMALSWTFDKIGPMAHTAEDCRLVLDAIAGPDSADPTARSEKLEWGEALKAASRPGADPKSLVSGMKAALIPSDYDKNGEPEAKAAFAQAVKDLEALGLKISEAKLPDLPFEPVAIAVITAEAACAYESLFTSGDVRKLSDDRAMFQYEVAKAITAADYVKSMRLRTEMQRAANKFFEEYDVIVAPNFLKGAPGVQEDFDTFFSGGDPVGGMGNACGLPSVALPMGFGKDHMPVGFQVMGAPLAEATVTRVGTAYQARTRWHGDRPTT
ncbi:MAG: amidase [Candidatus Eiseniibacteriota bacterium]